MTKKKQRLGQDMEKKNHIKNRYRDNADFCGTGKEKNEV